VTVSILTNQVVIPAIVVPILLYALYPSVKQAGLYWRDTIAADSIVTGRLAAMRAAATASGAAPSAAANGMSPPPATANGASPATANGAAPPAPDKTAVFELRDLWLAYPTADQPSLRGVTLRAGPGEFIGITGPSGAGKSTLLACLAGLVPRSVTAETNGTVRVLGHDVLATPLGMAGSRVGLVLQDAEAQIVGMTVAEDLAFGPENYGLDPAEIHRRSARVLAEVGLDGMAGRDTYALSGGQKQRLAIASALMMNPDLILLDEPTSELDPVGKAEVFEVVDRLRRQSRTTIVMVEHELDRLAGLADRLIVLDHGQIAAEGAPAELLSDIEIFLRTGGERPPAAAELQWRLRTAGLPIGAETSLSLPAVVSRIQALAGEPA
jgi:energy-coupling factor transport system ATP-binding protein